MLGEGVHVHAHVHAHAPGSLAYYSEAARYFHPTATALCPCPGNSAATGHGYGCGYDLNLMANAPELASAHPSWDSQYSKEVG
jgi:hypothetical protein